MPSDIFLLRSERERGVRGRELLSAVTHSHDVGLVYSSDAVPAVLFGMVEGVASNTLGCLEGNELDALYYAIYDFVLDARVLSFSVLANEDSVYVVIGRLVALEGATRTNVCKEGEGTTQRQVEGNVTLSDGRSEWAWEERRVSIVQASRRSLGINDAHP